MTQEGFAAGLITGSPNWGLNIYAYLTPTACPLDPAKLEIGNPLLRIGMQTDTDTYCMCTDEFIDIICYGCLAQDGNMKVNRIENPTGNITITKNSIKRNIQIIYKICIKINHRMS